jgi:hypothetical protein
MKGKSLDFCNVKRELLQLKPNAFVQIIEGDHCNTVINLFKEFALKFNFPSYFGENWAAFDECLNDLDWLNAQDYVLFITRIDRLLADKDEEFRLFISTLYRSAQEWATGRRFDSFPTKPSSFHVVFYCDQGIEDDIKNRFVRIGLANNELDM